jgi:hypothetical protein
MYRCMCTHIHKETKLCLVQDLAYSVSGHSGNNSANSGNNLADPDAKVLRLKRCPHCSKHVVVYI